MTSHPEDAFLEDLERLAQPDRFVIAWFNPDGALLRMIPRLGGLLPSLRRAEARLWSHLEPRDAAAARALAPGEALALEVVTHGTPAEVPRVRVTLVRRRDDLLLLGTVGSSIDDLVMNRMTQLNNETLNLYRELAKQKADLEQAMQHIRVLRGLLPICSSCKKIRNDEGAWDDLESYIHDHSEAEFSHGLCPTCVKKLYPED